MKYGDGITVEYDNGYFTYRTFGREIASFCAIEFCKALKLNRNWANSIKLIAYDRPAKSRIELYIDYRIHDMRVRLRGNKRFRAWIPNRIFHDLGVEPVEDTYIWLEVKQ